jgi:hypothetical protein
MQYSPISGLGNVAYTRSSHFIFKICNHLTRGIGKRFEISIFMRRRNTIIVKTKIQPWCILSGRKGLLVSNLILIATGGENGKSKSCFSSFHWCLRWEKFARGQITPHASSVRFHFRKEIYVQFLIACSQNYLENHATGQLIIKYLLMDHKICVWISSLTINKCKVHIHLSATGSFKAMQIILFKIRTACCPHPPLRH